MWLRRREARFCRGSPKPTPVYDDNTACIQLGNNVIFGRERAKHIYIWKHFAHEGIQNGEMLLVRVPTASQLADIFTKGLHYPQGQACVEGILGKTFKPSEGTSDLKRGWIAESSGDGQGSRRRSFRGLLRHELGMPRPELEIDFNPAQARLMTRKGSG